MKKTLPWIIIVVSTLLGLTIIVKAGGKTEKEYRLLSQDYASGVIIDEAKRIAATEIRRDIDREESQFASYPAEARYYGQPQAIDFSSKPAALEYRTMLREGAVKGPNFNGHYTVVSIWVTNAQAFLTSIIDARTGKILVYNFPSPTGFEFRLDSALLINSPSSHLQGTFDWNVDMYLLEKGDLKLIDSARKRYYQFF